VLTPSFIVLSVLRETFDPMDFVKRELVIPFILGGLLGVAVAKLQGVATVLHHPQPIHLEVLPYKK